jgi:hypothetical protein
VLVGGREVLVYTETGNGDMRRNTWVLPMDGDRKPIPFLNTGFSVDDGKSVARAG